MTTEELRNHFNQNYEMFKTFPETYEVNADTYANVCQFLFEKKKEELEDVGIKPIKYYAKVMLGKNCGVLFKGVELILKRSS